MVDYYSEALSNAVTWRRGEEYQKFVIEKLKIKPDKFFNKIQKARPGKTEG